MEAKVLLKGIDKSVTTLTGKGLEQFKAPEEFRQPFPLLPEYSLNSEEMSAIQCLKMVQLSACNIIMNNACMKL